MANFSRKNGSLQKLEDKVKHLEVLDIPLHIGTTNESIIGEGSSATVFKYMLRGKFGACKKFKSYLPRKSILKAASTLVNLRHENVVRFRGFSCRPSDLIMEYCFVELDEGHYVHSLRDLLNEFNDFEYIELLERVDYIHQACRGLSYLHQQDILCMDLKPSNMLVTGKKESPTVKITDFGEVSFFASTVTCTLTASQSLKGTTIGYVAPELFNEGSCTNFTKPCDIYAIGVSMYEILSDKASPWDSVNLPDVLLKEKVQSGMRPDLKCLNTLYADLKSLDHIVSVVESCWDAQVKRRPSASEIVDSQDEEKQKRKYPKKKTTTVYEEWITNNADPPGLVKLFINKDIGHGVFSECPREKGEFLLEYAGTLLSADEGESLGERYAADERGCYLYFFNYQSKQYCIDATNSERFGAIVNDSKNGNCSMRMVVINGIPHLCLFAKRKIPAGEELRYDYAAPNLLWRKQLKSTNRPYYLSDIKPIEQTISDESTLKENDQEVTLETHETFTTSNEANEFPLDDEKEIPFVVSDGITTVGNISVDLNATMNDKLSGSCSESEDDSLNVSLADVEKITVESHETFTVENKPEITVESHEKFTVENKPEVTLESHKTLAEENEPEVTLESHKTLAEENEPEELILDDEKEIEFDISERITTVNGIISVDLNPTMNDKLSGSCSKSDDDALDTRLAGVGKGKLESHETVTEENEQEVLPNRPLLRRLRTRQLQQVEEDEVIEELDDSGMISGNEDDLTDSDDDDADVDVDDSDYLPDVSSSSDNEEEYSDVIDRIVNRLPESQSPAEKDLKINGFPHGDSDNDDLEISDLEQEPDKYNIDGYKLDEDKSDGDKPDGDKPNEDKPDEDKPDEDKPDEDKPDSIKSKTSKRCNQKQKWSLETEFRRRTSGHKEHFCFLCGVRCFKLPRHFEKNHSDDSEVKEALSLPKGSKDRLQAWRKLLRKGDYEANLMAIKKNRNNFLAVVREEKGDKDFDDFIPCPHCFGFFTPRHLYRHGKTCFNKWGDEKKNTTTLQSGRVLLSTSLTEGKYENVHRLILSRMKRDDLHLILRNDNYLVLYAAVQLQTKAKDQYKDIRYSLRMLAKLLSQLRKTKPETRSIDMVMPINFDNIVENAKELSGYISSMEIKAPSSFLKYGFCLRKLALIIRGVALRENNHDSLEKIRNFLELYETDWQVLATQARECNEVEKGNAPEELPLESDIKKLRKFILEEIDELLKKGGKANMKKLAELLTPLYLTSRLQIY